MSADVRRNTSLCRLYQWTTRFFEAFRTPRIGLHVPTMDEGMMTPSSVHHDAWERIAPVTASPASIHPPNATTIVDKLDGGSQ